MKNTYKTSAFTIICALCATVAYGAPSVRNLGGAVTTGAASGTAAAPVAPTTSGGVSTAASGNASSGFTRGGSVRVTPATTRTTTASIRTPSTRTTGRVATTPRLSIGKYVGVAPIVSGTASSGTNGGQYADAETAAAIQNDVDSLKREADSFQQQLDAKQDKLTQENNAGDYVSIDTDGTVSVDVNALKNDLTESFVGLGTNKPVEIGTNEENELLWRFAGETTWNVLATSDEIIGPSDMDATIGGKISEALAYYYTSAQVDAKLDTKADKTTVEQLNANATTLQNEVNALKQTLDDGNGTGLADQVSAANDAIDALGDLVAGPDEELETTAQTLTGAVNEVRSYILPHANPVCVTGSNLCVLSINSAGELEWIAVSGPANEENTNTAKVATPTAPTTGG